MTFGLSYLKGKFNSARDTIIISIAQFDPEGATEAQIIELNNKVGELATMTAAAMTSAEANDKAVLGIKTQFNEYKGAATILASKIDAGDTSKQPALEEAITEAEKLKESLVTAEQEAQDSREWANEIRKHHSEAVGKLTKARDRLTAAKRDMERASREAERQETRLADRQRAMGITGGLDSGEVALTAMERVAASQREKAAAARLTSDALGATTEKSSAVEDALREARSGSVSKLSAADRLKAL